MLFKCNNNKYQNVQLHKKHVFALNVEIVLLPATNNVFDPQQKINTLAYMHVRYYVIHIQDRVLAAKEMVKHLKASHQASLVGSVETLCHAYIQLANWGVEKHKHEKGEFLFILPYTITEFFQN